MILLCVAVLILLQSPLAPFANKTSEYDGGVFIYGARELLRGARIYEDFFDHKGPLLYLLNALGLWLAGGRLVGIWWMEVVTLWVAALFSYKAARLLSGRFVALCSAVYALSLLSVLQPGQGAQHYALPFLGISLFLFVRGLARADARDEFFRTRELVCISVCFALVLLLQPNLAAPWAGFGLSTAVVLLVRGRYAYVARAAAVVVPTVLATLAPFVAYALHTGVLEDAVACYWKFNRVNPPVSVFSLAKGTYYALVNVHRGSAVIPFSLYGLYVAHLTARGESRALHAGLASALAVTLVLGCGLSGRDYPHYAIILVPLLCVTTAFVLEHLRQRGKMGRWALVCILASFCWYQAVQQAYWTYVAYRPDEELMRLVSLIKYHSAPTDKIAVVGNDSQLYYLSERQGSSRYHYTYPVADVKGFGIDVWQQYREDLVRNEPRLIIWKTKDYPRLPAALEDLVASRYAALEDRTGSAVLFKRRERSREGTPS
ncbi:MAG: hypothetical protein HY900_26835 [Deltaproteobacteria bacterium]|nr:hypothetical protein [Deltaproteobacteria bacterium]